MKQPIILYTLAATLTLGACGTGRQGQANAGAIMTGAAIGNNLGGAIGTIVGDNRHGWHGSYRGSAIGSIIGTAAGAAIGHAVSKPRAPKQADTYEYEPERNAPQRRELATPAPALRGLQIRNIRFIDENRDRILQAGETGKVIFDIVNEGNESALNVVPFVAETTDNRHITISPSAMVERIAPGCGVKYTATISAGRKLKNGEIGIHVGVADEYGNEGDWQEFTLPTSKK